VHPHRCFLSFYSEHCHVFGKTKIEEEVTINKLVALLVPESLDLIISP
jgi:hypothetical protein